MFHKHFLTLIVITFFLFPAVLLADDETCLACHDDPDMYKIDGGIKISLYANSEMLANSVHTDLSCTDCHSALDGVEDFPHDTRIMGVNCADCHPDAFDEYMSGFREHLVNRGYHNIPQCTQCHGKHNMSHKTDTRVVCGICHNDKRLDFEKSVHFSENSDKSLSCTSCHSAHDKTLRGSMLKKDWRIDMVNQCLECHKEHSGDYLGSHHFQEVKKGNIKAPICVDCHGDHEIYKVTDLRSSVNVDHLDKTCDRCHAGHNATLHRKSGVNPRLMTCVACHTGHQTDMNRVESIIFKETLPETCNRCHGDDRHNKENLAHGKIMLMDEMGQVSNCTSCHVYHWNTDIEEKSDIRQLRLACKNCHVKENQDYERSAHGISYRKGHQEAPTCITCHGDREVERISSRFSGQTIISMCGSCHSNRAITMKFQLNPNVIEGYLSTYHGQSYSLGYQGKKFATCISCHDNHLILPSDNPESMISSNHIVETCSRCHEDANENFVSMLQHYDPMTVEKNKLLSGIHTFMIWLLGTTLTIFGFHTLLWFGRASYDRIKLGPGKLPTKSSGDVRYLRFSRFPRIQHGLVVISFLLLAMTGLPLKYHHTPLAQWIAGNFLDLHTMAILHRTGAGITFFYFLIHIGYLVYKVIIRKRSIKYMLWGSDSMVPQPKDFVDFVQHIRYFLGLGKRPEFGRWTYWEKFDYFAVFWGITIIGLSGLTLWFPEVFTRILPGWAINAAHIIHSEEALLATGFIFTVHFFNVHLRPETFPFDEVIFTGRMNEHQLKAERPLWYSQLKESGKLEKYKVNIMPLRLRILLYLAGFAALALGLALLGMIIAGVFF